MSGIILEWLQKQLHRKQPKMFGMRGIKQTSSKMAAARGKSVPLWSNTGLTCSPADPMSPALPMLSADPLPAPAIR
jgi:hypothetical protein